MPLLQPAEPVRVGSPDALPIRGEQPEWVPHAVDREARQRARAEFLASVPVTCQALGDLLKAFLNATETQRSMRGRDLYRKVHFITAMAGLADCPAIGQMCSAFEALLFELMARPVLGTPSVIATVKTALDFLGELLQQAEELACRMPSREEVLVVDDDRLTNRLVVSALREAHLQASSTDQPATALQWAERRKFHLFLLDIEMPGMDGFELCKRLRAMPQYETTPVIYVTNHSDFESRSRSVLSGGNDLIAKPVLPMELAVKAVMHLLKHQLAAA
jgi:CheY-like chemotaxis protein